MKARQSPIILNFSKLYGRDAQPRDQPQQGEIDTDPDFAWAKEVDSRVFSEVVSDLAKSKARTRAEAKRVHAVRAAGGKTKFRKMFRTPKFKRKDQDRYRTTNDRVAFRRSGKAHGKSSCRSSDGFT